MWIRHLSRTTLAGAFVAASLFTAIVAAFEGCGGAVEPSDTETFGQTHQAVTLSDGGFDATVVTSPDPVPCAAWSYAAVANSGNAILNAGTLVDSYQSSLGSYGGSNVGSDAVVQAATTITNNGGVVHGILRQNTGSGFSVVPVAADAKNLPLGSATPGSLNINTAADSITLAPGDYVAANINVNFPGAIAISSAGPVRIWVTGNLNLGGNENLKGVPRNLAFLVTSSGWVNVNSRGALYGMIYAPTSGVTVNSTVFGTVIGASLSILNSNGAIHVDTSSVCPQVSSTPTASAPDPLPPPPAQPGCYIGTLNGWLAIPCEDPTVILPGFKRFDTAHDGLVANAVGATPVPKLVWGQVETTVTSITSETNAGVANNPGWSIQNNSNSFACNPIDGTCLVQFVACGDGVNANTAVCIEPWEFPSDGGAAIVRNFCVGANGQKIDAGGSLSFSVNTRDGGLQQGDFANVAGYTYTTSGQPMVGMVAQFSWVANQDVGPNTETALPNRIPGLYAVVTPDIYGLAQGWNRATGSLIGLNNGSAATFTNAEVLTRVAVSNCAGDVSASGPTCPSQTPLTAGDVQYTTSAGPIVTVESNNLTTTQATPNVSFPNANLAVTSFLGTTNVPAGSTTASCLASAPSHLYIRDNEGDNGGVPSNVGGVPFWESPDIFVVPAQDGGAPPSVNDTPADVQVTAGQPYNVYLKVHNEFGCNAVSGPISVFIDGADPNMGFANWLAVTPGADMGQYTTFGNASTVIAPAYGAGIIGPFPWTPTGTGHKCLLAAIAASNEAKPPASGSAPVLPFAYSSNQIAQRNLQIGSSCSYSITNSGTTSANLLLGISVTPANPLPGSSGGPDISLVFSDPGAVFSAEWNGLPGLSSVTNDGTNTTIVLSSSYVALTSVPLAASQSPTVQLNVTSPGAPPTVNVSAILTEPETGTILQNNGGSCTGTQVVIGVIR
jgi:hypothetical protein